MTTSTYRPRRSVLYMPSSNERALEKAKSIPCDALILDLEDAVAPDAKVAAREAACAAVESGAYGRREVTIRVNAVGTDWHWKDLMAVCAAGPDGIVVPKVSSRKAARDLVRAMERFHAPEYTKLWAMVETPDAIIDAVRLASASGRLAVLVMGTNDLVKEIGASDVPGRAPIMHALGTAVLAARAAGIAIVDGVYNKVNDVEGFEAECIQGRDMGFDGKTLIHPGQVEACNRIFAPSEESIAEAHEIIAAFEAVVAEGRGVVTVNGRMIENLHVEMARKVLVNDELIRAFSDG